MGLTALEIRNAKPGMHSDGGGLYLCVKSSGSQSWIFRYQLKGRRREMGLGAVSVLPVVAARAEAARLKSLVARGVDPIEEKRLDRQAAQVEVQMRQRDRELEAATFEVAAERYIASHQASWRNAKHRQQWSNTLATYAYPVLGKLPVRDIEVRHVLEVLQPIWTTKPETASRVRMRIEAVLDSAKLLGWRSGENPAVWRGGLEAALPRISKVKSVRHHPAMPWQQIPDFMDDLQYKMGISPRALEFTIFTAARSGEVRGALWSEIDLEQALWTIPASRMKGGRDHRVPLSRPAVRLLESLPRLAGSPLIFPSSQNRPLSDMTLSAVLKRMELGHFTVHGFRSSFRDWAAENTHHSPETVEMALAHSIGNKVEAAYRRGDLLAKRRALMDDWANYCWASPSIG